MNLFWTLLITALVLAPVSIFIDRVINPWQARKRIERLLRKIREGKFKPPHFDETVLFDGEGFSINNDKSGKQSVRMLWTEVVKATAYKRDMFSTDLICVFFYRPGETDIEIHEEMNNWMNFIAALPNHLPGCKQVETWLQDITVPAFAPNVTELFLRFDKPSKSEGAK